MKDKPLITPNIVQRRTLLQSAAVAGALAGTGLYGPFRNPAFGQSALKFQPEPGAKLNILRWKRFVEAEEEQWKVLLANFTKKTGVEVTYSNESFDDVQPKASVAANAGTGPDLIWGLHSLPHLFPDKLLDLSDLADYLGKTHGGWYDAGIKYGKIGDKWIGLVIAFNGSFMNVRKSHAAKAGFSKFPTDGKGFIEMLKAMKAQGTPSGFALGHSSSDGNNWTHWVLWGHGASMTDANDKVIINSPETRNALEFAKQMYDQMIPGVVSWNDASNNKAFLSGEISLTANGVSIWAAAKADKNPIFDDIIHEAWPVLPVGKPTELHTCYSMFVMKYCKYPNAAKAFMEYLLSAEAYNPWMEAASGYLAQSLKEYTKNKVWNDPRIAIFKEASERTLTVGYPGNVGEKATSILSDFVVLDMFANYCSGRTDINAAIAQAEKQAKRIYR